MDTTAIIQEIDLEIARLEQARTLLNGTPTRSKRGPKPASAITFSFGTNVKPRRTMSAEGRARIAAAQRARWAKAKKKG